MSVTYELRPALPSDRSWLDRLRRAAYRDLFDATWGGWDEPRHQRHFAACWELGHIRLVELDGERVGMLQLLDEPDAIEIAELQVAPEHQGRGLGTRVLTDVLADARAAGKPVRLRVGLRNERAVRLYERLGFRRVARTETHHHLEASTPAPTPPAPPPPR